MAVPVEAEAVWHHDQEPFRVYKADLLAEELRVGLRLPPERRDCAEVVRRVDERGPDLVALAVRVGERRDQLLLLRFRDLRVEGEEDLRPEQVVARRVTVGAGGPCDDA